jgi:hypothetical protein
MKVRKKTDTVRSQKSILPSIFNNHLLTISGIVLVFFILGCEQKETQEKLTLKKANASMAIATCVSNTCTNGYRWKYIDGEKLCKSCPP